MTDINERLMKVRHSSGLSQKDFAVRIGCVTSMVSDVERGKQRPPLHYVMNVVTQFNVDGHWLLTGKPRQREPKLNDIFSLSREQSDNLIRVKQLRELVDSGFASLIKRMDGDLGDI